MTKEEIYNFLNNKNISYEITEHGAVYNMEDLSAVELPYPDSDAKNLFVRDDKRLNYYLITVKGSKRVDLKKFRKDNGTRVLSFASAEDLMSILALTPGSVTPLGLLNEKEVSVKFYIDKDFVNENLIGIHPNDNTATIWLKTEDLLAIIKEHGNPVNVVEI
ncbi:MAG: prolyl-tRNA synthetase associated domain-containing protein [Bacilli bacterium]|nr:prolyl-tRNA synthetase associated domain-containing protein [Bacilli bacterium]